MDERFDQVTEQLAQVEPRFAQFGERLGSVEGRLGGVEVAWEHHGQLLERILHLLDSPGT